MTVLNPMSCAITCSEANFISPKKIRPKTVTRKLSQGVPKPGRCSVLTDTPKKKKQKKNLKAYAKSSRKYNE